jgi:hypothetical protein
LTESQKCVVPATSAIALPFLSLASAADTALLSMMDSFRRELALTTCNIRLVSLSTGFFNLPNPSPSPAPPSPALSNRLTALYASALSHRQYLTEGGRKGSGITKLNKKVFNIIAYGRGSNYSRIGEGGSSSSLLPLPSLSLSSFVRNDIITDII